LYKKISSYNVGKTGTPAIITTTTSKEECGRESRGGGGGGNLLSLNKNKTKMNKSLT
jgi:hypothetical protein